MFLSKAVKLLMRGTESGLTKQQTNTFSKPGPVRYALGRIQLDTLQETYLPALYDRTEARERFFSLKDLCFGNLA